MRVLLVMFSFYSLPSFYFMLHLDLLFAVYRRSEYHFYFHLSKVNLVYYV